MKNVFSESMKWKKKEVKKEEKKNIFCLCATIKTHLLASSLYPMVQTACANLNYHISDTQCMKWMQISSGRLSICSSLISQ